MLAALVPQIAPPTPPLPPPPLVHDSRVWLGGYDLSGAVKAVMLRGERQALPSSDIGDQMIASHPGRELVDALLDGFYSAGAGEPETILAPRILQTPDVSEWPLTILPPQAPTAAAGADGNAAYNLRAAQLGVLYAAQHGELLPFRVASRARTGRLDRGTVLLPKATYASTTTGTPRDLGVLSATEKMVCVLHVFAVTGGTWTLTVESDTAGFPSPIVRGTFTGATGITRQTLEISGPITDSFWRVVLTKSGGTSCVAAAVLAKSS